MIDVMEKHRRKIERIKTRRFLSLRDRIAAIAREYSYWRHERSIGSLPKIGNRTFLEFAWSLLSSFRRDRNEGVIDVDDDDYCRVIDGVFREEGDTDEVPVWARRYPKKLSRQPNASASSLLDI